MKMNRFNFRKSSLLVGFIVLIGGLFLAGCEGDAGELDAKQN
ncbi:MULTISPECIES: hypothetical protein [Listeria]|nr:hypothetical protein [Listeria monocytogenes]PIK99595.1 hypothetical protein P732_14200 [Listeria monocytogenes SHL015]UCK59791.1 hypothetical protein pLIS14_00056c [Listeria monocytogenes]UCK60205.1 hypothetical protein pLIS15_00056c [Listeria monocytogenes]WGO71956.1 hypothetical protein pLmcUH29_0012 [Listeria monocytogenes]WGO72051.1 hypothetical protein pLmcEH-6_0012 [Listeria monocytogenes]